MRFPAKKNAGCPKASRDFPPRKDGIPYPPVGLSCDSPPPPAESVRTDGRTYVHTSGRSRDYYVTTKISRIDRLPNCLAMELRWRALPACRLRYEFSCASCNACYRVVLNFCRLQFFRFCGFFRDPQK